MKTTSLGSTGARVSRICLGCMSYGSSRWRPWVLDAEDSAPFFRRAVELDCDNRAAVENLRVAEALSEAQP